MLRPWLLTIGLLAASAVLSGEENPQPVRLYTYEFSLPGLAPGIADRTFEAIRRTVSPRPLVITATDGLEELESAMQEKKADIVIAGAAIYRRHLQNGMRDLATLATPLQPNPDRAAGALLVTRPDSGIRILADLKGKTVAVTGKTEFRDSLILAKELLDKGFRPEHFFEAVPYGRNPRQRLEALLRGEVEAAAIPVCWAEEQRLQGREVLKGLVPVLLKATDEVNCQTSTALYPNWSILTSHRLKGNDTVALAGAIHRMPASSDGEFWTIASDFRAIDEVYRKLKTGPYAYLNEWTIRRLWKEYRLIVILAVLTPLFGLWHLRRTQKLVDLRTSQLREALEEQKRLSDSANRLTRQYETTRRALTVAQLSSMVAHELSQPLSGIMLYLRGLKVLLCKEAEKSGFDASPMLEGAEKAFTLAQKADSIVRSVRAFARSQSDVFEPVDIPKLIERIVKSLSDTEGRPRFSAEVDLPNRLTVSGSRLELEVAFSNLLKNSVEATRKTSSPKVFIGSRFLSAGFVEISVTDNGPTMAPHELERIRETLRSIKPGGLGLGLSIAGTIMERHCGRLAVDVNEEGRFVAKMILPVLPSSAKEETLS